MKIGTRLGVCLWLAVAAIGVSCNGQGPTNAHRFAGSNDAPGTVAFQSLLENPQWVGKVQPVKIIGPRDAVLATWEGSWVNADYANPTVAATVGPIYQVRLAGELVETRFEVYPSLELISCLNPPADLSVRFPVLVAISEDDIRQVSKGRMVTKVIYLENPETALPFRQVAGDQPFFDVYDREDPLYAAERLGRPMAILRLGSRQPSAEELNSLNGASIPMTVFPQQAAHQLDHRVKTVAYREESSSTNSAKDNPRSIAQPAAFRLHAAPFVNPPTTDQSQEALFLSRNNGIEPQPQIAPSNATQESNNSQAGACAGCPDLAFTDKFRRDEYLLDGGDRAQQAVVDYDWNVHGLDSEDTIAHFDTMDGRRKVVASNRVSIYAPRFAAVRKVSHSTIESKPTRTARIDDRIQSETTRRKDISSTTLQQLQPRRHSSTLRARGMLDQTRGVTADNVIHLRGTGESLNTNHQSRTLIHNGFSNSQNARSELGMIAARSWEDDLGLQVVNQRSQAVIVRDAARVQEFITSSPEHGDSVLRVIKLASAIAAQPGDEIEFTIQFDNVGQNKIGNVTIIDNLTPRLEYLPDSAQSSVDADFSTTQTEGSSLILKWALREPLDVRQGGVIRFKCRVR